MINLIETDVGRPVGHIVSNLRNYDDLVDDVQAVLDTLATKEAEVQSIGGAWFLMRIQPYRTLENVIEGVVITFVDISVRKQAQIALHASEERCRLLFLNMDEAFTYCRMEVSQGEPPDFTYLEINPAFERLSRLRDVVGKRVSELVPGIYTSNPELFQIYGRVAATGQPERFEAYVAPLGGRFSIFAFCPEPGHFVTVSRLLPKDEAT